MELWSPDFQVSILKTVQMHFALKFVRLLKHEPFIPDPLGATPWPVPGSPWRTCEDFDSVSWTCATARWMNFFEWLTLYSWRIWGRVDLVNLSTTCPGESWTYLWSFNSVSWRLCDYTVAFTCFERINPWFPTPPGLLARIVKLTTTLSRELANVCSSSIYAAYIILCDCTSNIRYMSDYTLHYMTPTEVR